jgi:phage terminase small subunit
VSRKPLSDRHAAFVRAYRETLNATEAARAAGYKGTDASLATTGSRLLRHAKVAAMLAKREAKSEKHHLLRREERALLLSRIAAGDEKDSELSLSGDACEKPPKMSDRLKALDLLGKMHGDHVQRVEQSGPGGEAQKHEVRIDSVSKLTDDEVIAAAKALLGKEPQ